MNFFYPKLIPGSVWSAAAVHCVVAAQAAASPGPAPAMAENAPLTVRIDLDTAPAFEPVRLSTASPVALDGINPDDPEQAACWAEVRPPAGEPVRVIGFLFQPHRLDHEEGVAVAGDPIWQVRYTPVAEGEHTVVLHVEHGEERWSSRAVSFDVAPATPDARGFVRIEPQRRQYLVDSRSGEAVWLRGSSLHLRTMPIRTPDFSVYLGPDGVTPEGLYRLHRDYEELLDKLQAAGVNAVRLRLDSWWMPLELAEDWTVPGFEPGQGVPGFERGRYHRGFGWVADEVFTIAAERGIYVQPCTWNHWTDLHWTNPQWAQDERYARFVERRLRHQVARWSYATNLIGYEMFNEENKGVVHEPWFAAIVERVRPLDPNGHLWLNSNTGLDLRDHHAYYPQPWRDDTPYDTREMAVVHDDDPPRPHVFGEYGVRNDPHQQDDPAEARRAEARYQREGLWTAVVTRKAGVMIWRYQQMLDLDDPASLFGPVERFLEGVDLAAHAWRPVDVSLADGDEPLRGHGMVSDAGVAVLYIVRTPCHVPEDRAAATDSHRVLVEGLPPGDVRVQWWSTGEGRVTGEAEAEVDAEGAARLAVPDGVVRGVAARLIPAGRGG